MNRIAERKNYLRGILAQGYCTKRNSKKVLDPDLIEDMIKAIIKDEEG
jgi:hypothetical protein